MVDPSSRIALLVLQGHLGLLGTLCGVGLVLGSLSKQLVSPLTPAPEFLDGSVFSSYLLPGLILLVTIGIPHLLAFVRTWRHRPGISAVAAATGALALAMLVLQQLFAPGIFPLGILPGSLLLSGLGELAVAAARALLLRRSTGRR